MKKFLKGNRGSMTLEATLVFPFVMVFVLLTVFLCILVFQMGTTKYVAYQASNVVAYNYMSSHKDPNGAMTKDELTGNDNGDGLYWRFSEGASDLLESMGISGFEFGGSGDKSAVFFQDYNGSLNVSITPRGHIMVYKSIEANVTMELYMPQMFKKIAGQDNVSATSTSIITDSTELVRNYNFARFLLSFTPLEDSGSITEAVKAWMGG